MTTTPVISRSSSFVEMRPNSPEENVLLSREEARDHMQNLINHTESLVKEFIDDPADQQVLLALTKPSKSPPKRQLDAQIKHWRSQGLHKKSEQAAHEWAIIAPSTPLEENPLIVHLKKVQAFARIQFSGNQPPNPTLVPNYQRYKSILFGITSSQFMDLATRSMLKPKGSQSHDDLPQPPCTPEMRMISPGSHFPSRPSSSATSLSWEENLPPPLEYKKSSRDSGMIDVEFPPPIPEFPSGSTASTNSSPFSWALDSQATPSPEINNLGDGTKAGAEWTYTNLIDTPPSTPRADRQPFSSTNVYCYTPPPARPQAGGGASGRPSTPPGPETEAHPNVLEFTPQILMEVTLPPTPLTAQAEIELVPPLSSPLNTPSRAEINRERQKVEELLDRLFPRQKQAKLLDQFYPWLKYNIKKEVKSSVLWPSSLKFYTSSEESRTPCHTMAEVKTLIDSWRGKHKALAAKIPQTVRVGSNPYFERLRATAARHVPITSAMPNPATTDAEKYNRIQQAMLVVLTAPEFQKICYHWMSGAVADAPSVNESHTRPNSGPRPIGNPTRMLQ